MIMRRDNKGIYEIEKLQQKHIERKNALHTFNMDVNLFEYI